MILPPQVFKGIANRDEYGGGLKGAVKCIGKAMTGGDTDDKLDKILAAVSESKSTAPPKIFKQCLRALCRSQEQWQTLLYHHLYSLTKC
jgi:hypothetical protein